jgi:hypothetical protein
MLRTSHLLRKKWSATTPIKSSSVGNTLIGVPQNNPHTCMIVFLLPPSLWTYSLMTIISIETRKHLAESTAPAHSFKQRVENQNHHLHYLQAQALTQQQQQKTLWLAPTQGRTKYLVLAQLRVSNNDSQPPLPPPTWPCPTTHYLGGPSWSVLPCGWTCSPSPTG